MKAAVTAQQLSLPPAIKFGGKSPNYFSTAFRLSRHSHHSSLHLSSSKSSPKFSSRAMSIIASAAYNQEEARVPPAVPLPKPPITKFKIGLCQFLVTEDKDRNIARACEAIEEAAGKGAQLVLLPEIWKSPYSNDCFPVYAEDIEAGGAASPSTATLSEISKRLSITIVGGSIPECSGDRLYNTCCVFGTDGKIKGMHRKIHLFDIDIPGKMTFMESMTLTAGESPTVVDTGAHLLCYPGAFNMTTGPLHWELLQRARAADCQFGEVIATTEHKEDTVVAEIDYSLFEQRRTYLPFLKQRRGDLYQLVDVQRLNSGKSYE